MTTIEQFVELLTVAIREPLRRSANIAKFQALVWEGIDPALPPNVRDVLRDLAYDLDFFEARRALRNDDGSLYGHERAETEIRDALEKLKASGVSTPR